jgi:hypothetical protein
MRGGHGALTFRDGDNDDGDGDNKDVHERDALLGRGVRRLAVGLECTLAELDKETDHQRAEEEHAGGSPELRDKLREIVELQLERCVLCVAAHR